MESVGDFILVLVHCLAHIQVDNLADDANPLFLRYFYKVNVNQLLWLWKNLDMLCSFKYDVDYREVMKHNLVIK